MVGEDGKDNKKKGSQLSNSLLLGKSEGPSRGIGDHHTTRRNRPHGLWSRPWGEGGIKGLKRQRTLRFWGLLPNVLVLSVRLVYGADRVCLGSTKAHTPSVQLPLVSTSTGPGPGSWGYGRGQRQHKSRQRSKLAEGSQEGEKGREKWKVPWGEK